MLKMRRTLCIAVTGLISLAPAAFAEVPYDPVARAILLGLTPEMVNAKFDRAMNEAEGCDAVAVQMQVMGCMPKDFAATLITVQPAAES